MTPNQEKEMVDSLKSIAVSLEQLLRYAKVVTHQKLGIAPVMVQRAAMRNPPKG